MDNQFKIALLIDAENVSRKYVKLIMDEISKYGIVTYKRVYGDFTIPSALSWKENLRDYAMTPIFQINYTKGKNASDSAMVIDAMDILYSGKVNGFCLVTSDSDFTKLAIRLREAGMLVIGMGEQKTPGSLVAACEAFKFLDLLYHSDEIPGGAEDKETIILKSRQDNFSVNTDKKDNLTEKELLDRTEENNTANTEYMDYENSVPDREAIKTEIGSIIDSGSDESGWMNLAPLGNMLLKRIPGFDPRNYGYKKLRDFIESYECFETRDIENPKDIILKIVFVKRKNLK